MPYVMSEVIWILLQKRGLECLLFCLRVLFAGYRHQQAFD
jgi:hypothetical protein